MSEDNVTHRLNRIIGQLEAIKRRVNSTDEHDCVETVRQLKASINGLKKCSEYYIKNQLKKCIQKNEKSADDIEKMLSDIISSAFSL